MLTKNMTGRGKCSRDNGGPVMAGRDHAGQTKEILVRDAAEQGLEPDYFYMNPNSLLHVQA